ncbi:hypothetical protein [Nocardioides sp.]|uniref:hypothetical protein n=1 Tax=Nocardioides sp. TaxID=35761 RepID=UPI003782DF58
MESVVGSGEVYAQLARGLHFAGGTLTLLDVSPSTIWMSPVPRRLGFLRTGAFLDLWADVRLPGSPGVRRVEGTLALLDADSRLAGDARLALSNPRVTTSGLTYDVEVTTGLVPAGSGACVLFMDWDTASS